VSDGIMRYEGIVDEEALARAHAALVKLETDLRRYSSRTDEADAVAIANLLVLGAKVTMGSMSTWAHVDELAKQGQSTPASLEYLTDAEAARTQYNAGLTDAMHKCQQFAAQTCSEEARRAYLNVANAIGGMRRP